MLWLGSLPIRSPVAEIVLGLLPFGDAFFEELFVGVGDSVAFGAVGSHGFDAADVFVFVEIGEDLVFLDVEDQVGEGAESVLQLA